MGVSPPKRETSGSSGCNRNEPAHSSTHNAPHLLKLAPGTHVRARGRPYRVRSFEQHVDCQTVRLSGADRTGESLVLLTPFDRLDVLSGRPLWRRASLIATVRAVAVAALDALGLRRLASVAVRSPELRLLGWQLTPLRSLREGHAARLLVADAVGLGKTIQAGLAHVALCDDSARDRTLVLVPAGLRDQWLSELTRLFALRPIVMDSAHLRQLRRTLPAGVNAWALPGVFVSAIDFAKQPEILAALLEVRWRLVILDEAHGLTGGTDRHRAAHLVARTAEHVIMLTATPHSGDRVLFDQLCGIGERGGDHPILIRRTRADVRAGARRRVRTLRVRPGAAERRLHAALRVYLRRVRREGVMSPEGAQLTAWVLIKRAASSARALRLTLCRRREALGAEPAGPAQSHLPFGGTPGETQEDDDWLPAIVDAPALRNRRSELEALEFLIACAGEAERHDRKVLAALRLIRRVHEPVLVFTEYRDTLKRMVEALPAAGLAVLHGGMMRLERRESERAFAAGSVRVLLATDAASEGLNLHQNCRVVVNLDVPWNPTRLEQRVGRVDRIGQQRTVHAITLVSRAGDSALVSRLNAKMQRIDHDLSEVQQGTRARAGMEEDPSVADALVRGAVSLLRRSSAHRHRAAAARGHARAGPSRMRLPWVRVHPSVRSRLALPTGVLLVFRAEAATTAGGVAAVAAVAVIVELDASVMRRCAARTLIAACASASVGVASARAQDILLRDLDAHGRRTAAVRRRLAAALDEEPPSPAAFQPGLFDRRAVSAALRLRSLDSSRREELERALVRADAEREIEPLHAASPVAAFILR
jgi:superfamily II DNA or RNA helicase